MALFTGNRNQVLAKLTRLLMVWTLLQAAGLSLQACFAQTPMTITAAEILITDTDSLPDASAAWSPATLPLLQSFTQAPDRPGYVWLRFSLPAATGDEKLGMLIKRHMRNLTVHVNGQLLHSERSDATRDYLGWNTPLLVEMQTATLSRPQNEVVLGLYQSVGSTYLNAPVLGAWSQVEPLYRSSYFMQVQIAFVAFITCMVLGLLTFGLWVTRRQHLEHLYFCASSVSWALVMLFMAVPQPLLMNLKSWIVLSYFNTNFAALAFIAFVARVLKFRVRFWLRSWLVVLVLLCALILLLPPRIGFLLAIPLHGISMVAVLLLTVRTLMQFRRRHDANSAWISVSLVALLILPAFDMVHYLEAFLSGAGFSSPTLTQFSFPFSLAVLFVHIIHKYWTALRDSEGLNHELVERVQAATLELEQHLNLRHQQELQQSTQQERQKIYRDLHDDVGAKLTSILHAADSGRQKQMARAALESLRETIHHANYQQQTLQELVDSAAEEMQIRLEAAGLQFRPVALQLASDRELSSQESYHLTRALREITNNILHHARATAVQLTARDEGRAGYLLEIQDDGRGFRPGSTNGNGLGNIEQRLRELQGKAVWNSSTGRGCKVQLWLPPKAVETAVTAAG